MCVCVLQFSIVNMYMHTLYALYLCLYTCTCTVTHHCYAVYMYLRVCSIVKPVRIEEREGGLAVRLGHTHGGSPGEDVTMLINAHQKIHGLYAYATSIE